MKKISALLFVTTLLLGGASACADEKSPANEKPEMNEKLFKGMPFRGIGPGYMSGRIADIDIDKNDPATWYVAVGSGGVWKTMNGGITWIPVFDDQSVYSIGDVTIDPNNSNVIWVGSGENTGSRHIGFGDGVYKSLDGGASWDNMGLKNSEHISDIIIDPNDSNTVYVSSQGPLWSKGGERGLFKNHRRWAKLAKYSQNR